MAVIKNPTTWEAPSGQGYIINAGTRLVATNLGSLLVTNSGNQIVTTPTYPVPKYVTTWQATGV